MPESPRHGLSEATTVMIDRLAVPVVAAPMLLVSGHELVSAASRAGVVASFPTANCREDGELEHWLTRIRESVADVTEPGPVLPNLIVHPNNARLDEHLQTILEHRPFAVITSVGSPTHVIGPLHEAGIQVWSDVASVRHVEKAVALGVDGLILLSAGAGGQTGWANPFAFVRAARARFDGLVVLAGGIADGHGVYAAQALGADLAYMGTRFIATSESRAETRHRDMIVNAELDDIHLTTVFSGLQTNMLRDSIVAAGLDPADCGVGPAAFNVDPGVPKPKRWRDVWSAGHSASGVDEVLPVAEVVRRLQNEYAAAKEAGTR